MGNVRMIEAVDKNGKPCNYLSQIKDLKIEDLDNTNLNKVTTGSGFTTLILESKLKYVICVPFKSLILNKEKWCKENGINVLAVYGERDGGATNSEIKSFNGDKILVTWNSLLRLIEGLGDEVKNYRLAIDESHKLIDAGAFRTDAIQDVIENYVKFKSVVLATATPIDEKYMHTAFKELPKVTIKWSNLEPVTVKYSRYSSKEMKQVGAIIGLNHLIGETLGNAHIFINSVTSIGKILNLMNSNKEFDYNKVRIVAANTDLNKEKIKRFSSLNLGISSINDEVKKLNFYTSTAFEGCDIFDKTGKIYIISDGSQDCSKINITTQLPQIIGRIRDNVNKNYVELIYSPNRYFNYTSKVEFEFELNKIKENALFELKHYKDGLSKAPDPSIFKSYQQNAFRDNPFILERNENFVFNELAWCNELHNFETVNKLYYVPKKEIEIDGKKKKVIPEGQKVIKDHNHITYNYDPSPQIEIKGFNKSLISPKVSFKDLCLEYIEIRENIKFDLQEKGKKIELLEPIIKDAYSQLGPDKMKALKFRKTNIKRELALKSEILSKDLKIAQLLGLQIGKWISSEKCKSLLQNVYSDLSLNLVAKTTDLDKYFSYKVKVKRENGIVTRGIIPTMMKYSISQK